MGWHVDHELSIHFCMNLKFFCCPFCCHLMSVHLPWKCHLAHFSQIANLKTTPLLPKLHNIVKFPSIQLRMQTSLPSRPGLPILCIFLWSGITAPPPAAAGYQTDGCALEFFIHASYNGPVGHMTTSHDLGSGSKCGGVWTLAEMAMNQQWIGLKCEHSFFKKLSLFRVAYSHE